MADDPLLRIVTSWDEISWITKRRIDWLIINARYNIDNKIIASVLAITTILLITAGGGAMLKENLLLFVSIILLKNIYGIMIGKFIAYR